MSDQYDAPEPEAVLDLVSTGVKKGRPPSLNPDERTINILSGLAQIQCTKTEAAAVLHVSLPTFNKFLEEHEEARMAWDDGLPTGKMSLRRKQFKHAERSPAMAIFLGKNYLGQKDVQEIGGPDGGAIPLNISRMTNAQLDRLIDRIRAQLEAEGDAGDPPAGEGPAGGA